VRLTRLKVRDFRNHARAELDLGPRLTVLHGPNGAGKTNLLEALYFGCVGRSCRTANEREVVRRGAELARVSVEGEDEDGRHLLEVGFVPGETKQARVDGARVERPADAAVRPLVSVFLPERLELVKGGPAPRRAHLDQLVAALWPARASARAGYVQALGQRNALLARVRAGRSPESLLDPWDHELARHGAELMAYRDDACTRLEEPFRHRAADLGLDGPVELRYRPRSPAAGAEELAFELGERRASDLERGFTTHGPHRDELELRHDGRPLRGYGSQGQQRLAVLSLLFAERDVLSERRGTLVMLLDDVMSELDRERRGRLSELIMAGGQTVLTATESESVPVRDEPGVVLARVEAGRLASANAAAAGPVRCAA
jgi:DNA replication and repair protein RecF